MSEIIAPSNLVQCRGKLSYPTRQAANAARSAKQVFNLSIYACGGCGGFHLGRDRADAKEAKPLSDQTKARLAKAFTPPATPLMAILAEVADLHCVSIGEMRGRRATIKLAMARQHAIYEIRRQRGTAIGRIAHFFDRNHQTVIHALRVWPEKAAALGIPCEPIEEAR